MVCASGISLSYLLVLFACLLFIERKSYLKIGDHSILVKLTCNVEKI